MHSFKHLGDVQVLSVHDSLHINFWALLRHSPSLLHVSQLAQHILVTVGPLHGPYELGAAVPLG